MGIASEITDAVTEAIQRDGQQYKYDQVMQDPPYGYDTPGKIRDFLLDVAHELANDDTPVVINVDNIDKQKAMADTVVQLEADILSIVPVGS